MTVSLARALSGDFVRTIQAVAQGSQTPAQSLRGGSEITVQTTLRSGAQTFSTAVQNVNATISFLNSSTSTLKAVEKLTDKMLVLAEEAAAATTSRERREDINFEFLRLGREFEKLTSNTDFGDFDYLSTTGVEGLFARVGLDQENSQDLRRVLRSFETFGTDPKLASEQAIGDRPLSIPESAYVGSGGTQTRSYSELFTIERQIDNRVDAYLMVEDLTALKNQITTNLAVVERAQDVIGANLELLRVTGLAMLELENQVTGTEDAEELAALIRKAVRSDASAAARAQAGNLNAIVAATLELASNEDP